MHEKTLDFEKSLAIPIPIPKTSGPASDTFQSVPYGSSDDEQTVPIITVEREMLGFNQSEIDFITPKLVELRGIFGHACWPSVAFCGVAFLWPSVAFLWPSVAFMWCSCGVIVGHCVLVAFSAAFCGVFLALFCLALICSAWLCFALLCAAFGID